MPVVRIYGRDERPLVKVLIEGKWCQGELWHWKVNAEGLRSAQVHWHHEGEIYSGTFAADRIRPDESDRRWA